MTEIQTRAAVQADPLVGEILDRGQLAVPGSGASLAEATAFLTALAELERARQPLAAQSVANLATLSAPPQHPGIDITIPGFVPPAYVPPLPPVPETRSWAPLALLVCGGGFIGSAFLTIVTAGNPVLVGTTLTWLVGMVAAFGWNQQHIEAGR